MKARGTYTLGDLISGEAQGHLFVPDTWCEYTGRRDKPIEDEILAYVRAMKRSWQGMVHSSIWPHVRKSAEAYVSAYTDVEDHIVKEIELRKKMADIKADHDA